MTIEEARAQVAKAKRELKRAERKLKLAEQKDKVNQLRAFFKGNFKCDILIEFKEPFEEDYYYIVKGSEIQTYKEDNTIVVLVPGLFSCSIQFIKRFVVLGDIMEVE